MSRLSRCVVAVYGIGGVGTYAVEGLVRAGVGNFVLIDDDSICLTNINRQLHATRKTIGRSKVEVMKERILDINPQAQVMTYHNFYSPETSDETLKVGYDYIIDAIDNVTGKVDLAVRAGEMGIPIISSMGTGNKLDPTRLEISDIYKTSICPLAKIMRKLLRRRGVNQLKVVYSKEEPLEPIESASQSCKIHCVCPSSGSKRCAIRHRIPGSISFVPAVAGLIIAGEVVADLIKDYKLNSYNLAIEEKGVTVARN